MRDGRQASVSATFDRRATAEAWVKRKDAEVKKPGGFDRISRVTKSGHTLAFAIDRYIAESERELGRTKSQVLNSIKSYSLAGLDCGEIRSKDIVAFVQELLGGGRKPQTVNNYLSHLTWIFQIARPAWGMDLHPSEMAAAMVVCKKLGVTTKSAKRDRRPSLTEMNLLMEHFADRYARGRALPMHAICAFALYSTRRQEEIVRIQWSDLEPARVLVRDMKHPGEKVDNHQWVELPPEAERIASSMPRTKSGLSVFR